MRKGIDCKNREWEAISIDVVKSDLTKKRFGLLTAMFPVISDGKRKWLCICDCGNETVVACGQLNANKIKSCGCSRVGSKARFFDSKNQIEDLRGVKYGKLTVLDYVGFENGASMYLFDCDCGNQIKLPLSRVKNCNTSSCGCLKRERSMKYWENYREQYNLVGSTYGNLTVVKFLRVENEQAIYLFKCICGNYIELPMIRVKCGNTLSCGCLWKEWNSSYKTEIIGQRFGKLVVDDYIGVDKYNSSLFRCKCDCGNETVVTRYSLIGNRTHSCGCIASVGESNIKKILNENDIKFKSQYSFADLLSDFNSCLFYDFGILDENGMLKRLVEFDGLQHSMPFDHFGGEDRLIRQKRYDYLKNQYAKSHNIPLVRIPYDKRDSMTLDDILGQKYLLKEDDL